MKLLKTLIAVLAFGAASAYAVDPQRVGECADLQDQVEPTAEALERFSDLQGTCEGVYEIEGVKFVRAQAVVRRARGGTLTLYMPATDHTFNATPDGSGRVWVGNRKMRIRDLNRGDEIGIYLKVDSFFEDRVQEVAFAVPDDAAETHTLVPLEDAPSLPTTASLLPALGLTSGLLFAAGMFMRRFRKTA